MKRSMSLVLFVVVVLSSLGHAGDVYISNNSPASIAPETSADAIFMSELRKLIPHYENMRIVSESADLEKWQQRQHGNDDVLLELSCGALDDANGVGPDGKHIEVVAFSIWITESGKPRSLGSTLTWFRIDNSLQRTTWNARQAASSVASTVNMMSLDNALVNAQHSQKK